MLNNGNSVQEVIETIIEDYEIIKAIGAIFILDDSDMNSLCETLERIEDLPENCLFSDDLLTKMRTNNHYWIRRICAMNGRPEDLDILVTDKNDLVRFEVLFHKRPQDLQILKDDNNMDIREAAISWSNSDCTHNGILGRY